MSTCCLTCTEVLHLGCYAHCDPIATRLHARLSGLHRFRWLVGGVRYETTAPAVVGQFLTAPNHFSEQASIVFQIIQPDGTLYVDDSGHDCFAFTSVLGVAL